MELNKWNRKIYFWKTQASTLFVTVKAKSQWLAQAFSLFLPHIATAAFQRVCLLVCWQWQTLSVSGVTPMSRLKTCWGLYFLKVVLSTGSEWWTWSDYLWNVCPLMICSLSPEKHPRPPLKICRDQLMSTSVVSSYKHLNKFHNITECRILPWQRLCFKLHQVDFIKWVFHTQGPITAGGRKQKFFGCFCFPA